MQNTASRERGKSGRKTSKKVPTEPKNKDDDYIKVIVIASCAFGVKLLHMCVLEYDMSAY